MTMNNLDKYYNGDRYLVKYDTMASLEHIAAVRCIIALLDYREIQQLFAVKGIPCERAISGHLYVKITKLHLPSRLHEKLMRVASRMSNQIYEWIKYHDEQIFNIGHRLELEALGYVSAITWTSRGTIDYLRSARTLIDFNFRDDIKFRITYAYCLDRPKISHFIKGLDPAYTKAMFPQHGRDFLPRSALYYWIRYQHSDTIEARRIYGYGIRSTCRVEEFLFNIFVRMPNYVLTKLLWNALTNTERIERTMDLVTTNISSDLQLYFLSQLSVQEQNFVINCYRPFVFKILVNDYHLRSFYDDLIEYIWNVMSVNDFIEIIKQLFILIDTADSVMQLKYKHILKDFWSIAPIHLRHQVLQYNYELELQRDERTRVWQVRNSCTILPLKWQNNEDIVHLVLSDATIAQRKCFLESDSSVYYAIQSIKKGKHRALQSFISHFLPDLGDQQEYKIAVICGDDYALVKHFCNSVTSDSADAFYRWCFPSKLQMRKFIEEKRADMWHKMRVFFSTEQNFTKVQPFLEWCLLPPHQLLDWLHRFQLDVWYEVIRIDYKTTVIEIENFLDWSFDTTSELNKAQIIIPRKLSLFTKFICGLIKRNNIPLLDQLLNWCFLFDQRQIQNFKNKFCDYCDLSDFLDLIEFLVVNRNDIKFHAFNTFFGSWFGNENDFQAFKLRIMQLQTSTWIGANFVSRRRMRAGNEFFKFCTNFSDHQVAQFKYKILLHESMAEVLKYYKGNEGFLRSFLQWVDPPRGKYQLFKEKFILSDKEAESKL